jgi:BASS family bile acid:Na+ symporter
MNFAEIISKIFLPISLAIIMLGMGMSLIPQDFKRIINYPKAVLLGLINQLVILPIIGFILAIVFNLSPTMSVGIIILAICPGGPTSNLIVQICKGNIALSVTLTAISSFICVFTIPYILFYTLNYFESAMPVAINLPIIDTITQIMGITILPIITGMLIRKYKTSFAVRMKGTMRKVSTVIFILVFIAVITTNFNIVITGLKSVGLVMLLLNIVTIGIGYFTSRLLKLDRKSSISITIESGIQNGTLAFVIATSILYNIEMAIPTAAYVIWMYFSSTIMIWQLTKTKKIKFTK